MRGTRQRRRRPSFLLTDIVPMAPYLHGLIRDLRDAYLRRETLDQRSLSGDRRFETYEQRRERYFAAEDMPRVAAEIRQLEAEFRRLGVVLGDVLRGEMLFPCFVDERDAFFVWRDPDEVPTAWRFANDDELRPIPPKWFHLVADSRRKRLVSTSSETL